MRTRADSERGESAGDDDGVDATLDLPAADPKRYRLHREQGRGGLGCVYAAQDTWLDREVAVKRALDASTSVADARFVREALVASRLQHPGIVPVYDAGRFPGGEPFYAMKLVGGRSLADALDDAPALADRLAFVPNVLAVVEAIAYAHDRGIIHRDLKPANVMLGEFGETLVVDWGLARDVDAVDDGRAPATLADVALSGMTNTGAIMGTPGYMAPEQARGEAVDERADVYALGAILYTVVAGASPVHGVGLETAIERCIAGDVPPLDVPGAPPELATIAMRAMAADPAARYTSAKALAEDLRRFTTGQLVASHDYSAIALVRRFVGRHRAAVGVGASLTCVLAITAVVSARRIITEGDRARASRDELLLSQAASALERDPTAAIGWLKHYPIDGADWGRARQIATDAESLGVARHVIHYGDSIAALSPAAEGVAIGTPDGLEVVDGRSGRIVSRFAVGSVDYTARDPESGVVLSIDESDRVFAVPNLMDPNGSVRDLGAASGEVAAVVHVAGDRFAIGDRSGGVTTWSSATGFEAETARHDSAVYALAAVGGGRVASLDTDGVVLLSGADEPAEQVARLDAPSGLLASHAPTGTLAIADGTVVYVLQGGERHQLGPHTEAVTSLAFSPDGAWLASGGEDHSVRLWPIAGGDPRVLTGHAAPVHNLAFSPDGRVLASLDQQGGVWLWREGGAAQELRGHRRTPWTVTFSLDSRYVATSDVTGEVRVWPIGPAHDVASFPAGVWSVRWLGERVVATSPDGAVRAWRPGAEPRVLGQHAAASYAVEVGARTDVFATGGWDGTVKVWDVGRGLVDTLPHGEGTLWNIAVSPDLSLIAAVGAGEHRVSLWDRSTSQRRWLVGHGAEVATVDLSPDATRLVTNAFDGSVIVWNVVDGTSAKLGTLDGVAKVMFVDGGRRVASAGAQDGEVRLWDVATGEMTVLGRHARGIRAMAVSPDGSLLATGSKDHTVRLWDLATGKMVRELRGHDGEVRNVAFSPDGALLASAGWDRVVRLWNVRTGASRALRGHTGDVFRVAFSPDGKTLASSSRDGTIALWPVVADALPVAPRALRAAFGELTSAVVGPGKAVATPADR